MARTLAVQSLAAEASVRDLECHLSDGEGTKAHARSWEVPIKYSAYTPWCISSWLCAFGPNSSLAYTPFLEYLEGVLESRGYLVYCVTLMLTVTPEGAQLERMAPWSEPEWGFDVGPRWSKIKWLGHLVRMLPGHLPDEAFRACPSSKNTPRSWRDYDSWLACQHLSIPM